MLRLPEWLLAGPEENRRERRLRLGYAVLTAALFLPLLCGFLARRKSGATSSKWRGWGAGIGLGLSGGIARYAAVPLASAVNAAGVWLTAVVA